MLPMLAEERRRRMLDRIHQKGMLSVAEMEQALRVSRMTIHRDLEVLAAEGCLRKVHGGAVSLEDKEAGLNWAQPFDERYKSHAAAKQRIARHLVSLLSNSTSMLLDASSTIHRYAQILCRRIKESKQSECFVITGGLRLFEELACLYPTLRVALHGGEPHPSTGSLVGPLVKPSLAGVRCEWAVVSAAGMDRDTGAIFDATPEEAEAKRAYLACAQRRALALDTSKFKISAPFKLESISAFDVLVTEKGVSYLTRNEKKG